ncbi:MAG TPA: hypothetical protein VFJ43_12420, partial [Bacteroidia bacterium]|nr:hypothetical protein [Bacteroidia bacterium]
DRFQPVSILGTKLVLPMVKTLTGYLNPESNDSDDISLKENRSVFFQKMVNENLRRDGKLPTDAEFNKYLTSLHEWVDFFRKNNVRIVFYEMPEDEKLKNAPGAMWIRKALMTSFPSSEYLYMPNPENLNLHTTDGKHLDKISAKIYSGYFRKEALKIMQTRCCVLL